MHDAGDREAVLRLGVLDGVPSGETGSGLDDLLGAAAQDLVQQAEVEILHREVHEVEGDHRRPPIAQTSESELAAAMRPNQTGRRRPA